MKFWRRWLPARRYRGRWRETVDRSALTLKLLTFAPTGALVAAPRRPARATRRGGATGTTATRGSATPRSRSTRSSPRLHRGGARLHGLAGSRPARASVRLPDALQIMYGIDGRRTSRGHAQHLEGATGAPRPVRIGNGAADQLQLDIYGELMDSVYLYNKYRQASARRAVEDPHPAEWISLTTGTSPTRGSGEPRGGPRSSYSGSCAGSRWGARFGWQPARPPRRRRPMDGDGRPDLPPDHGARLGRRAGGVRALLRGDGRPRRPTCLMPLFKFHPRTDPRWTSTLDAIRRRLVRRLARVSLSTRRSEDGLGAVRARSRCAPSGTSRARARRAARRGAARLREDAHLRQPPGPVLGGDRPGGRAPRQLRRRRSRTWR